MKKHIFAITYTIGLIAFTTYISLDTFVIARSYNNNATEVNTEMFSNIENTTDNSEQNSETSDKNTNNNEGSSEKSHGHHKGHGFSMDKIPEFNGSETPTTYNGETSYHDDNVNIEIKQYTEYNTQIYVADVTISSTEYLKAAFANDSFGKNITETTSSIAESKNAVLAINGDYYGARESGYVIRNGVVYRAKLI